MKSFKIAALATVAGIVATPALAQAQDTTHSPIYGSLGYAQSRAEGVDLGSVQGRLGARLSPYFGVEGELATGVDSDRTYISGVPVKVELEHQAAMYGVGFVPLSPKLDLFARVGYGDTKIKASVPGASATADGDSWNYGAGAQYFLDGSNGVRADYTRHDFRGGGDDADVWSVGYVRKF